MTPEPIWTLETLPPATKVEVQVTYGALLIEEHKQYEWPDTFETTARRARDLQVTLVRVLDEVPEPAPEPEPKIPTRRVKRGGYNRLLPDTVGHDRSE